MHTKSLVAAALAAACVLASLPAAAQNWIGLLKNTAAEHFDDEDLKLFLATARQALSDAPDNQTLAWNNPATRAHGDITVLRSYESKGRRCKDLRIRNEAGGRKGDNKFSLCNVEGKWRMLSATPMNKL